MSNTKNNKNKARGATTIEYVLLVAIIGITLIAACTNLGGGLKDNVKKIGDRIEQSGTSSEQATKDTH